MKSRKLKPVRSKKKKSAARAVKAKSDLKHFSWTTVEAEQLTPLLQRQFIVGGDVMVARLELQKGCIVPAHSHHHEQVSCVIQGLLKFLIDGKEMIVGTGEVLAIPRNMPHGVEVLEDSLVFDIFNPPRQDWINKTDLYLRSVAPLSRKGPQVVG